MKNFEPKLPLASHRDRESIVEPFLVFSAFVLLALIVYVVVLMPVQTPEQREVWVSGHQAGRNFIMAKKMIAKLLPSPPIQWSTELECGELGHGVWFAQGLVGIDSLTGELSTKWTAIFIPATSEPLYLAVGSVSEGDSAAALRLAGIHPRNP